MAAGLATMPRVLIVDDDPAVRDAVELVLEVDGYEVVVAENGSSALSRVAESPPDVILLDIRMPVMDGRAFARAYRETAGPHAPIIVLTATTDNRESLADIGAADCIFKPFRLTDVLTAIERARRTPAQF